MRRLILLILLLTFSCTKYETVRTTYGVGRIDEKELQHLDTANYSGTSHLGKTGVEKAYESVLHGKVGYQHVETNARP